MKYTVVILMTLVSAGVFAQDDDSLYVKEFKRKFPLLNYYIDDGDTINRMLGYDKKEYRYGHWKFYYENGSKRSEGFISWKKRGHCATGMTKKPEFPSIEEWYIGDWGFWDEAGFDRTILDYDENPTTGYFSWYRKDGVLMREGEFENGKLLNGKIYHYSLKDRTLYNVLIVENGRVKLTDK